MKRARTARRTRTVLAKRPAGSPTGVETVSVPVSTPRNPYVSLARSRKAGAHGGGARTRRQAEKRELRAKLLED
jgi:hypothetical protein